MGNRADILSFSTPIPSINALFSKLQFWKGTFTYHRKGVGNITLNY